MTRNTNRPTEAWLRSGFDLPAWVRMDRMTDGEITEPAAKRLRTGKTSQSSSLFRTFAALINRPA